MHSYLIGEGDKLPCEQNLSRKKKALPNRKQQFQLLQQFNSLILKRIIVEQEAVTSCIHTLNLMSTGGGRRD
jgi:hypothetical protein